MIGRLAASQVARDLRLERRIDRLAEIMAQQDIFGGDGGVGLEFEQPMAVGALCSGKRRSGATLLAALRELDFVAVRSHADTLRIVQQMQLQDRLRLVTEHFLVLPSIVMATDLAAIMPRNIARGFEGGYAIVEPAFPQRDFTVSLHWSRRFDADPGHRWLRALIADVFRQ